MANHNNGAHIAVRPITFDGKEYAAGETLQIQCPKKLRSLIARKWIMPAPASSRAAAVPKAGKRAKAGKSS